MVPTWWYREWVPLGQEREAGSFPAASTSFFATLRGGAQAGASQAALRVFLAIAAADRPAKEFVAQLSLDQLEELTKLSRSMVLKGITTAVAHGLIAYVPGKPRTKSTFTLLQGSEESSAGGGRNCPMPRSESASRKFPTEGM